MSERDYLISKAHRSIEEYTEGRKRAFRDPAFLAGGAAGVGGAGVMLHGVHTGGAKINAAESAARAEGKKGFAAIKPALKVVPKRYWGGAGAAVAGGTTMGVRNRKHRRDIIGERAIAAQA